MMARKVFFSFHYDRDVWRVNQVRNSQTILSKYQESQFLDAADWEKIKRSGQSAVRNWIDSQLYGTSCTVVLIGNQTSERPWVHYEIQKSWERGNGLLGITIHNLKSIIGYTDQPGLNPFNQERFMDKYGRLYSPRVYNWITQDGRTNVADWIEQAILDRNR
jgi:hypothetical protein